MTATFTPRPPVLLDYATTAPNATHWQARGQNFHVDWQRAPANGIERELASADELLLLVLDAPITVRDAAGASTAIAARSVAILPAGQWQVTLAPNATCVTLRSLRAGAEVPPADNAADYLVPNPRVTPLGAPYQATQGADTVRVLPIDAVQASPEKPRLKMLQTATLSINWVEYDGPRDRHKLSPHAHASFEQGSLALAGDFVHHLRAPWGEDAELWVDDQHAALGAPSLMVVPPGLIHTSEGVGPGHHLLIDIFSPPRADFIAKGWVANAGDYRAGEDGAG